MGAGTGREIGALLKGERGLGRAVGAGLEGRLVACDAGGMHFLMGAGEVC